MAHVKQHKTAAATIGIIITTTATKVPRITTTTTTSRTTTGQMHELKAKDIKVKSSLGCFAPASPLLLLPLLLRFPTWHSTHWLNCECIIHEHRRRDGKADAKKAPKDKRSQPIKHSAAPLPLSLSLSLFLSLSLSLSIPFPAQLYTGQEVRLGTG